MDVDKDQAMPKKISFDETQVTPAQRKALGIARAQGVEPVRSITELHLDVEQHLIDELVDRVMGSRLAERRKPNKDRVR